MDFRVPQVVIVRALWAEHIRDWTTADVDRGTPNMARQHSVRRISDDGSWIQMVTNHRKPPCLTKSKGTLWEGYRIWLMKREVHRQ